MSYNHEEILKDREPVLDTLLDNLNTYGNLEIAQQFGRAKYEGKNTVARFSKSNYLRLLANPVYHEDLRWFTKEYIQSRGWTIEPGQPALKLETWISAGDDFTCELQEYFNAEDVREFHLKNHFIEADQDENWSAALEFLKVMDITEPVKDGKNFFQQIIDKAKEAGIDSWSAPLTAHLFYKEYGLSHDYLEEPIYTQDELEKLRQDPTILISAITQAQNYFSKILDKLPTFHIHVTPYVDAFSKATEAALAMGMEVGIPATHDSLYMAVFLHVKRQYGSLTAKLATQSFFEKYHLNMKEIDHKGLQLALDEILIPSLMSSEKEILKNNPGEYERRMEKVAAFLQQAADEYYKKHIPDEDLFAELSIRVQDAAHLLKDAAGNPLAKEEFHGLEAYRVLMQLNYLDKTLYNQGLYTDRQPETIRMGFKYGDYSREMQSFSLGDLSFCNQRTVGDALENAYAGYWHNVLEREDTANHLLFLVGKQYGIKDKASLRKICQEDIDRIEKAMESFKQREESYLRRHIDALQMNRFAAHTYTYVIDKNRYERLPFELPQYKNFEGRNLKDTLLTGEKIMLAGAETSEYLADYSFVKGTDYPIQNPVFFTSKKCPGEVEQPFLFTVFSFQEQESFKNFNNFNVSLKDGDKVIQHESGLAALQYLETLQQSDFFAQNEENHVKKENKTIAFGYWQDQEGINQQLYQFSYTEGTAGFASGIKHFQEVLPEDFACKLKKDMETVLRYQPRKLRPRILTQALMKPEKISLALQPQRKEKGKTKEGYAL